VIRAAAILAGALVFASASGAHEQHPGPLPTAIPEPFFEARRGDAGIERAPAEARPLGPGAPPWARRLHDDSVRVLLALTDPETGAQIAGDRERWDLVWPRDAAAGALAFESAGLRAEAHRVVEFLRDRDLEAAARFEPDGGPAHGRPAAGDAAGWVAAAEHAVGLTGRTAGDWRDRQDYGENMTGDLLGNAIASGAPAAEVIPEFSTARGLVREEGSDRLDSAAAWAVVPFARGGLREEARRTLLALAADASPYGIEPMEGWSPGQAWTAPTAWSAWALTELGETKEADRLLGALRRAASPEGALPERVSTIDGSPTSTTPLAWSHAFAILALRARYARG
jgi:hypothetical protein